MPVPSPPASCPPSGITSRRRRKMSNKENTAASANSSSLVNENETRITQKKNPSGRREEAQESSITQSELLLEFKSACTRTSEADFWRKQEPLLAESVIEASLSMPQPPSNSLVLAEYAVDLLNVCRRLVKDAASSSNMNKIKNRNTESMLDCLCVAVHTMRALATVFDEGTKKDAAIKLLYHAIVSLEATVTRSDDVSLLVRERAANCCFGAFHALAVFLEHYSVQIPGQNRGILVSRKQEYYASIFPVPVLRDAEGGTGSISLEQFLVIGVQSILAAAKILSLERPSSDAWTQITPVWKSLRAVPNTEASQTAPLISSRHLICHVAMPWMSLLVSTLSTKEATSYCRRAYRVLWEAASSLSVTESGSDKQCLELRGDAVMALLCYSSREVPHEHNAMVSVRSALFEYACSSAWKSAAMYAQASKSSSDNHLVAFHDKVGPALDSCSTVFCSPFAEYCAFRALHCGRVENANSVCKSNMCLFRGLPYYFPHSCCSEDKWASEKAFLALYFLVLDVKEQLVNGGTCRDESLRVQPHTLEVVTDQFNKVVLRQRKDQRLTTRAMTWFKLLSALSLHQSVFQAVENFAPDHDSLGDAHLFAIAGKILTKCIGPLIHCMIKTNAFSTEKLAHVWDLMTECYVRAAFAFNKLDSASQDSTKEALGEITSILCSKSIAPPLTCVENVGKSLSKLGRIQWDDHPCKNAMIPLLHSLQLFMSSAQRPQQSSLRHLQLSVRWSSLAAMYKSLELVDESFISVVMALVFDIIETATVPSKVESDLRFRFVNVLASFSKGSVALSSSSEFDISENRRKLIARLLLSASDRPDAFASASDLQSAKYAFLPQNAIEFLLVGNKRAPFSEHFQEKSGAPSLLASILHATLTRQVVSAFPEVDSNLFLLEVATTVAAILAEAGNFRQAKNCVGESSLNDCEQLCKLAASSVSTLLFRDGDDADNSEFLAVARSLVYVVASACLVPKSVVYGLDNEDMQCPDTESLRSSYNFISKGCNILCVVKDTAQRDWNSLLRAVRLATRMTAMKHPCSNTKGSKYLAKEACDLVRIIKNTDSASDVLAAAKYCVMRSVSGLSDYLSLQGDHLEAALLAFLNRELALDGDNDTMRTWLETTAFLRSSAQSVASVVPAVNNGAFERNVSAFSDSEALTLHIQISGTKQARELERVESKLQETLDEVENALSDAHCLEEQLSLQWVNGSVYSGLAACRDFRGDLEGAIVFLKKSYGICKKLIGQVVSYCNKVSGLSQDSWKEFSTLSLHPRALMRMADCLHGLSEKYSRLGDHRKAIAHAKSLLDDFGSGLEGLDGKSSLADLRAFFVVHSSKNLQEYRMRQIFLSLKARSIPIDIVCSETDVKSNPSLFPDDVAKLSRISPESIFDRIEVCEVAGEAYGFWSLEEINNIYRFTRREIVNFLQTQNVTTLLEVVTSQNMLKKQLELAPVAQQAELSEISFLVSRMADDYSLLESDMAFLRETAELSSPRNTQRARAFYLLGVISLKRARFLGHLESAWNAENKEESELLLEAQRHFKSALELLGASCDVMTRDTMRCLALASGRDDELSPSLCRLVNASIGRAARRAVVKAMSGGNSGQAKLAEDETETLQFLSLFECVGTDADRAISSDKFFQELKIRMPANSRFVSLSLCPTGELLASAIEISQCGSHLRYRTEYVSPPGSAHSSTTIYDCLMRPLDTIVQQNQDQLSHPAEASKNRGSTEDEKWKRSWWKQRNFLDSELKDLLDHAEVLLFSNERMRRLFVEDEDSAPISQTNLVSRFQAASREFDITSGDDDPSLLRVAELREELTGRGVETKVLRKMKKAELVELAIEHRRRVKTRSTVASSNKKRPEPATEQTIFLILDENLNRFPFESLPCFNGRAVCRLPSLPFALIKLRENFSVSRQSVPSIDPSRVSYVLDPESNLQGTQDRLGPLIESFNEKHGAGCWNGIIGEVPSPAFMEKSLTNRNGMLLYFGHGGGQQFLSWEILAKFIGVGENGTRRAESSIVLMGCSSGRLESVNRKGSKTIEKVPLHFEPEGIALSYIQAGAPCVVGNLWDVTDRDIDRFAASFLEQFFEQEGSNRSIAQCVAEARSACKLRYLVGCAPVCYGIPVFNGD